MSETPRCKTMRELARHLGLDQSTVSLALRNDPRLTAATRQRVKAAAEETGYRPDPRLATLMHYLKRRPVAAQETIAFVLHATQRNRLSIPSTFGLQHQGARARADTLGFGFEDFVVGPGHYTPRRLNQVLIARGIRNVIIGPMPTQHEDPLMNEFEWNRISAVTFNFRYSHQRLHRVASDHVAGMLLALERLWSAGYRRIGFVLGTPQDVGTRGRWRLAYNGWVAERRADNLLFTVREEESDRKRVGAWFRAKRPDAIVGICDDAVTELRERGWRCPGDFGYVRLDWYEKLPFSCAGVNQFHFHAGECAVDLLSRCQQNHEFGIPAQAQLQIVGPIWQDGPTM